MQLGTCVFQIGLVGGGGRITQYKRHLQAPLSISPPLACLVGGICQSCPGSLRKFCLVSPKEIINEAFVRSHLCGTVFVANWNLFSSTLSVQFSRSVVSDSLRPHELQHARPSCPSPTSGVHSNSRPSSP